MCIALLTTAHPSYALIILSNRDEFILRPTSRPHWWSSHGQHILSARDLQRPEQGTWLGITTKGKLAILTNFHETEMEDPGNSSRSRGAMALAWLTSPDTEQIDDFIQHLLESDDLKGVGGFSLICGQLEKPQNESMKGLSILSNRTKHISDVPVIAHEGGNVYGLSNTTYDDPIPWPKVETGKEKLIDTVRESIAQQMGEQELTDRFFEILDTDTMPPRKGESLDDYLYHLRESIFIPLINQEVTTREMPRADEIAAAKPRETTTVPTRTRLTSESGSIDHEQLMSRGYGTQRQTVVFVRWDGHVIFKERSLYDEHGKPITKGTGDLQFEYDIEAWE